MTLQSTPMLIKSLHHDYEVTFDETLTKLPERLSEYKNVVVVIDKRVQELYGNQIKEIVARYPAYPVPAYETTKTLDGVKDLVDWLLEQKCNRSTTIVAIGGGIIQDLVTFTSNIFYRGSSFVLVPTTLLSMADSCIGAKCGINYGNFKNQLGVMHSPKGVHIVSEFLETLNDVDVKSGYGEILKLSITGGMPFFQRLTKELNRHGLRGPDLLGLIHQSLEIKKRIIEEDEHEADLRRILNYGHTFGHALEALSNHAIPHGLAVAWGIDLINFVEKSERTEVEDLYADVSGVVSNFLSFQLTEFPSASVLLEMTKRDKKMVGSTLNLVVPQDFGDLVIRPTELDVRLERQVANYLQSSNVYARR